MNSSNSLEDICYLFKLVANQISRIQDNTRSDKPANSMGVLLSLLAGGREMNQLEIANALQIRPASLSETIVKLEKRGLVKRKKNDHDRRNTFVSLTEEGAAVERQIRKDRERTSAAILSVLTPDEVSQLHTLLRKMSIGYLEGRMQPTGAEQETQGGSEAGEKV